MKRKANDSGNTLFGFPINRVVLMAAPFTTLIAGKIGLWLFANVGLFSAVNIGSEKISKALVQIFAFVIPAILTWAVHNKFITGWQLWESKTFGNLGGSPIDIDTAITDENLEDVSNDAGLPTEPLPGPEGETTDLGPEETRGMPLGFEKEA